MKQETKIDTPKNLEARITAALTSTDITSTDLEILLQETENVLSETAIRIERERAFDLTKSPDVTTTHRTLTENELVRGRLKLKLPELQQKFAAAREREDVAQWEIEHNRVEALRDKMAEKWARVPVLINELISIFTENEALNKQISNVNGAAPPGKRRLLDAELLWRGLDAFSRSQPPISKGTTLPVCEQRELSAWPPRSSFIPFGPPQAVDLNTTSEWGRAAEQQRRLNNERIDRELAEMERQRKEFYAGR